jgi:hypothetical protein
VAVIYRADATRRSPPHPLSWFPFGILSLTGYLVQRGRARGNWTLLATIVICFLFVAASVAGGRSFSRLNGRSARRGAVSFAHLFRARPTSRR